MELENRSLPGPAAAAWEKYLDRVPTTDDRLEICYRVGKLYLQAEQYAPAAAAFVHAEQLAGDNAELKQRIGPQLVTCLRRLGLYGEVGRELSRRVETGAEGTARGKVLATLAGEPLTEADLDRLIERRVDQMLAVQGAPANEAARQTVLRELSAPAVRNQLFQELLQRELFTRRARELKLDRDDEFLAAQQALSEDLLARRFQDRELGQVKPTETDLTAFHQAHPELFRQPESLRVTYFKLRADEQPAAVLKDVKSAEDFSKLAGAARRPTADRRSPPAPRRSSAASRIRNWATRTACSRWPQGSGPKRRTSAATAGTWCWWKARRPSGRCRWPKSATGWRRSIRTARFRKCRSGCSAI